MTTRAQRLAAVEEQLDAEPPRDELLKVRILLAASQDRERILRAENRRLAERLSESRTELSDCHELIAELQAQLAEARLRDVTHSGAPARTGE